ncbi:hypothetical protein SLEP1_g58787 [Rubroshorea leprosula]|uniref:Uncharacterized protein n=1 Tax=Rubroshorea leprosula TaxID=152421 RepID=A0AAV5MS13_9ROSI|nr:hypothetical protein SLEP1_g58787 [Rubroshorea leprosula]
MGRSSLSYSFTRRSELLIGFTITRHSSSRRKDRICPIPNLTAESTAPISDIQLNKIAKIETSRECAVRVKRV